MTKTQTEWPLDSIQCIDTPEDLDGVVVMDVLSHPCEGRL